MIAGLREVSSGAFILDDTTTENFMQPLFFFYGAKPLSKITIPLPF